MQSNYATGKFTIMILACLLCSLPGCNVEHLAGASASEGITIKTETDNKTYFRATAMIPQDLIVDGMIQDTFFDITGKLVPVNPAWPLYWSACADPRPGQPCEKNNLNSGGLFLVHLPGGGDAIMAWYKIESIQGGKVIPNPANPADRLLAFDGDLASVRNVSARMVVR